MGVTLYPGKDKYHLDYCTFFLDANDMEYEVSHCYFGYRLQVVADDAGLNVLASHICSFIFEFYLKESVTSKIYDEYPLFNTDDASHILSDVSDKIAASPIKDDILVILKTKSGFNPESYFLFNMKSIMICVYALTDDVGRMLAFSKEKDNLISLIKTFSNLSFEKCRVADVEFSLDDKCSVSFDKQPFGEVPSYELLSILAQKAPESVNIINSGYYPELADVIEHIFNSKKS